MNKQEVTIISVDPGFDRLGVAVIGVSKKGKRLVESGCWQTNRQDAFETRLFFLSSLFREKLNEYKPSEVVFEDIFFSKNQKTAIGVAKLLGALINETTRLGIECFYYSPKVVKNCVTGDGSAKKDDIIKMVPYLIDVDECGGKMDDEWDAIAVGLTHLMHKKS